MIIRSIDKICGSGSEVASKSKNWVSRRLLLKKDGMGFSLHDTVIHPGTETEMWYRNHLEAVYCVKGEGILYDVTNDQRHIIKAGTMYALNGHEKHVLSATTKMRMICVFNPPCTGNEDHDEDGVYPLLE